MYFEIEDLQSGIFSETLTTIARTSDNMQTAINDAISEVRTYLDARYNLDEELNRRGDQRCQMLLKIIKDIAIYNCYCGGNPSTIPELRRQKYEDALKLLQDIRNEKNSIDLPRISTTQSPSNYVRFGANKKRNNYF